jgi:4-amino-4-deoxy-L-arabinose transferase-like glycosyltransferase
MAGLYLIGSELFDRKTGLIAALFYGVFQSWWTWKTVAFDGEMLMNLPIIWAWAIAFRRSSSRLRPELLPAGALLGAAFLLKQPAAIAAIPLGIYLLLPSYRDSRSLTPTNSILQATMLTAGFVAAVGLVTVVIWKQGILPEAFYWTIADHDIPHVFWERGILLTLAFIGACLPLVVGAIMACRDRSAIWAGRRAECPIDPFARTAGGAVLRTTLVPDDGTAPLATTPFGDVCVAGSHCYCPLNRSLDGAGFATGSVRSGTIFGHAFGPWG